MKKPLRVLMVEDSEDDALLVIRALKNGGYEPEYERMETAEAMRASLREKVWDVVFCDYMMPKFSGLAALALLKESDIDIPLIIVSGAIGEETAADCMRLGARDYVMKGNLSRLVPAVERELKETESRIQRRRAEEKLKKSEDEFHKAFHLSPVPAAISMIEDGRFLDVNEIFLQTTLFSSEEVIGKTSFELGLFANPAQRQDIRNIMEQKGYARNIEVQMVAKNGQIIDGLFSAEPVTFNNEKCWLTVLADVTEQKQMEMTLRRMEENFRRSLDDSPLGVRIVTVEGETIYANRTILDIYGFESAEELRTAPIGDRYTPESHVEFKIRREKRKGGADVPSEYTVDIIRKNGEIRHLQVFRKEILWDGERQFQVIYQDITERKRAEEALLESEARYRQLVEYAPAAMYEADLTTGRLLSVNEVLCEYSGYTRDELLALNPLDLLTEESRKLILQRMAGYAAGEPVPPNVEYKARSKSGREFWISTHAKYFYREGLPVRATVIAYDITEGKRAEDELRASGLQLRELAMRLQQIREEERIAVAREIHDEMGGGLTGLKMDLSQLLRVLGDADPFQERVDLMNKIHAANASIDQMIQVVRRISMELRPSVLDDLGLMAALEWQLSEFTSRTAIPHEFITTFEYIDLEEGKAVALFRIFQEALTNVVRHSRATKVVVVLREGERGGCKDETLVLEIRDNGRGITEEEILNRESLGLLGMKERVLAFGGELSIHGEPGGGTGLVLKIPRKQGEAP